MALNFPFSHDTPYGEPVASMLEIPVKTVNGLNYVGFIRLYGMLLVSDCVSTSDKNGIHRIIKRDWNFQSL